MERVQIVALAEDLFVHQGAVRTGIVRWGERAILIECGDPQVVDALVALGVRHVEAIYLTHHHRDQLWGWERVCQELPPAGGGLPQLVVPAAEREWLAQVAPHWSPEARQWHRYDYRPHTLLPAVSLPVTATSQEPDSWSWGPAQLRVLETPGHTDGSVTLEVATGGRRFAFVGDLLYGPGQVWDVYSLQKGGALGPGRRLHDYHGFLGAKAELIASLQKVRAARPDVLVPAHGVVMEDPAGAIDQLLANLEACYEAYAATSALRYYFPQWFATGSPGASRGAEPALPLRPGRPVPPFLRHIGTSWVLVADDGSALVMDCGSPRVLDELRRLLAAGELRRVDGLWISHYHDDHVDAVPAFQAAFSCPTYADEAVARVITRPQAYCLPCLSPAVVRVDHWLRHGQSWRWREFQLTSFHFPGQTLYHGALLVEGHGLRLLFAGDSFTPAGMDDYCAGNRNLLGSGQGYDACLALLERLRPDLLFNCHVDEAFAFAPEDVGFMRANLSRRRELFARLLPWDDPNYGLDEHWARCQPYAQEVRAGGVAHLELVITNHSATVQEAAARPVLPAGWGQVAAATASIPAHGERAVNLAVPVPAGARPGHYAIPVELVYGGLRLGPWREALLTVAAP